MAELTLNAFVSLDGVMQAPGGTTEDVDGDFQHGGWVFGHDDEGIFPTILDSFEKADAFLLGRRTYDIFAGYWPAHDDPANPIAVKLNRLPKHVASRSSPKLAWTNSHLMRDPVKEIAALKAKYEGDVLIQGSADLLQTLIAHDLIDEYRLMVFPVTLGTGKRLFGSGTRPTTLQLVRTSTTDKATQINVFRRGGALKTGTYT